MSKDEQQTRARAGRCCRRSARVIRGDPLRESGEHRGNGRVLGDSAGGGQASHLVVGKNEIFRLVQRVNGARTALRPGPLSNQI